MTKSRKQTLRQNEKKAPGEDDQQYSTHHCHFISFI